MTKEQIKRALEIGEEEMCSPEMIEHCVFCREFMTPAMEALRKIEQLKRERDAAISDIPHKCWSCGKGFHTENGFDCDEAHYRSGYKDCLSWRWRGQKEER